jgi:hypothetical protein
MYVLAIDPGFRATGWVHCVFEHGDESNLNKMEVLLCGVIENKPGGKTARALSKGHEDTLAMTHLASELAFRIQDALEFSKQAGAALMISCELPTGSISARSARCIGMAYGTVLGVVRTIYGAAPFGVTPEEARRVTGKRQESKDEMIGWARTIRGWDEAVARADICYGQREHVADATAIAAVSVSLRQGMGL